MDFAGRVVQPRDRNTLPMVWAWNSSKKKLTVYHSNLYSTSDAGFARRPQWQKTDPKLIANSLKKTIPLSGPTSICGFFEELPAMKNYNHPIVIERLLALKAGIRDLSLQIQKRQNLKYMQAREAALNMLGFNNSFAFDRWFENELESLRLVFAHKRRAILLCHKKPSNSESVYIFECSQDYLAYDAEMECYEELVNLHDEINQEGLTVLQGNFKLRKTFSTLTRICNIWVGGSSDLSELIEERVAHCSCRSAYAFEYAERSGDKPVYRLENADDIVMWANCWGSVAFFNDDAMNDLARKNPQLQKELTARFLVAKT